MQKPPIDERKKHDRRMDRKYEDSKKTVGVKKRYHDPTGKTVAVEDIDESVRREWARTIASKIRSEINGIEDAMFADASPSAQSVGLEVTVTYDPDRTTNSSVYLTGNPRSIRKRLDHMLGNIQVISSYKIPTTPTAINAMNNLYDSNFYRVDLWFP